MVYLDLFRLCIAINAFPPVFHIQILPGFIALKRTLLVFDTGDFWILHQLRVEAGIFECD